MDIEKRDPKLVESFVTPTSSVLLGAISNAGIVVPFGKLFNTSYIQGLSPFGVHRNTVDWALP